MTQKEMKSLIDSLKDYPCYESGFVIEDSLDESNNKIKIELIDTNRYYETQTRLVDACWIEPTWKIGDRQMILFTRALDDDHETFLVEAKAETIYGLLAT